jgi:hypothetical protein
MKILLESESEFGQKGLVFYCPGCKMYHSIITEQSSKYTGPVWAWNGSMEKPTFSPSLLIHLGVNQEGVDRICHLFIQNGEIKYLDDSTHELRGQTVPMESAE